MGGLFAFAVVLVIALAKYGLGFFPGFDLMVALSASWQSPGLIDDSYLLTSAPTFILAGLLQATAPSTYFVFALGLAIAALGLPFLFRQVRESDALRRGLFFILVGGPITPVLMQWLGSYDAISVVAGITVALSRTAWLRSLGWLVLGLNSFFVGLIAAVALAILTIFDATSHQQHRILRPVLSAAPLFVGGLCAQILGNAWGMNSDRIDFFFSHGWRVYLELFTMQAPMIIFSALGATWFLLLDGRIRRHQLSRVLLIEVILLIPALALISLDQTRVIALVLLIPTVHWLSRLSHDHPSDLEAAWKRFLPVAVVVPVVVVYHDQLIYLGWRFYTWIPPLSTLLTSLPWR